MEQEQLNIFDEKYNHIGVASRKEVHEKGYWHEAFHCWIVSMEDGCPFVYLQLRSQEKKDYPYLLDITAAGHLLSNETVKDGVREVKEEIGIDVAFQSLLPLGVLNYSVHRGDFIDKEIAHVFLHLASLRFEDLTLQKEEVAGMVKVELDEFEALWDDTAETIQVEGFEIDQEGCKRLINERVGKEKFVPHEVSFYKAVIERIKNEW
ncbi:NUDIX hydrolase [Alkalihalobacillus sp. CinArs1]|uniref:NUDIX hydrolase n=1 Tax=Alkalihalobacillus sp. CinArs1 TaxID=2995314 RepID=UPI0022DD8576|nr:NUDIX domain-containing protein [Alkalihalobacillus sp. CinArs1]